MSISASQGLKDYAVDLVLHLPLYDDSIFFAGLYSANLLPLDFGNKIRAETRADKVLCFLDLIMPGADIYLPKLLEVMADSGAADVMQFAAKIAQQLE